MDKKISTIEERSAGGVVYRSKGDEYEFLLGKHSGYHKWVLPKGLIEEGEGQTEAAIREVAEEVGVIARIVDMVPLKVVEYYYFADVGGVEDDSASGDKSVRRVEKYQEDGGRKTRVHKIVTFYLMEYEQDLEEGEGWEMEEVEWLSYNEATERLAFDSEQEVLEEAGKALKLS